MGLFDAAAASGKRLPPGQKETAKWPVLTHGETPKVSQGDWRLAITGLVDRELTLDWAALKALPAAGIVCDMHCVTRWSKLGNRFTGARVRDVLAGAGPRPQARYVMAHCYGGYTTNLPLADLLEDDALLAYEYEGAELEAEHGGPCRLLVPKLYLWKSAKWINGLELMERDQPGFWERGGYHMYGDPWKEERYGWAW